MIAEINEILGGDKFIIAGGPLNTNNTEHITGKEKQPEVTISIEELEEAIRRIKVEKASETGKIAREKL